MSHPHCIISGRRVFTLKIQNITKIQALGWMLIIVSRLFVAVLLILLLVLLHNYHKELIHHALINISCTHPKGCSLHQQ